MKNNIAILTGFSEEDIREMIDHLYGSCIWEKLDDGSLVCYPTSAGKIHLTSRRSGAADICPFCNCIATDAMGHCKGCGKLIDPPPA